MNIGKTLFAQIMDFLPWKTFHRIVGVTAATIASGGSRAPSNSGVWPSRS